MIGTQNIREKYLQKQNINLNFAWSKCHGRFCRGDFAEWEASATKQFIEVLMNIAHRGKIDLLWNFGVCHCSCIAVFVKISWNFHLSLCGAFAGNQQYITGLSTYHQDLTCSDGLLLLAAILVWENPNVLFGRNWVKHSWWRWFTLRAAPSSY